MKCLLRALALVVCTVPYSLAVMEPFDLSAVRLTGDTAHTAVASLNTEYLLQTLDADRLLCNFWVNAGEKPKGLPYKKSWEDPKCELRGHFTGHYLTALSYVWRATGSESARQRLAYMVSELAKVQEKLGGGYLSAFPEELFDRLQSSRPVWAPYYTIHKIMAGLLDAYNLVEIQGALPVVKEMAAYFLRRIDTTIRVNGTAHWISMLDVEFGGMNDVMYNLYRVTKDPEHLRMARLFDKPRFYDPLVKGWDPLPELHANTHLAQVVGFVSRYEVTNDADAKKAVTNFFKILTKSHSYVTAGSNYNEHWYKASWLGDAILSPDNSSYTEETCTQYNLLKIVRGMFQWTGDVKLADHYERAILNGIIGVSRVPYAQLPKQHDKSKTTATETIAYTAAAPGDGVPGHANTADMQHHIEADPTTDAFDEAVIDESDTKRRQLLQDKDEQNSEHHSDSVIYEHQEHHQMPFDRTTARRNLLHTHHDHHHMGRLGHMHHHHMGHLGHMHPHHMLDRMHAELDDSHMHSGSQPARHLLSTQHDHMHAQQGHMAHHLGHTHMDHVHDGHMHGLATVPEVQSLLWEESLQSKGRQVLGDLDDSDAEEDGVPDTQVVPPHQRVLRPYFTNDFFGFNEPDAAEGLVEEAGPGRFLYMLPLGIGQAKGDGGHHWGFPLHSFWCCYGTAVESFAKLHDSIWFRNTSTKPSTLVLTQLTSNVLTWKEEHVQVALVSNLHGPGLAAHAILTFSLLDGHETSELALSVRIPSWTKPTGHIKLNGQDYLGCAEGFQPGSFCTITRSWKTGDTVTLDLPYKVWFEVLNDKRKEYQVMKGLVMGPFVMAGLTHGEYLLAVDETQLESKMIDPPNGKTISLRAGWNESLALRHDKDLLYSSVIRDGSDASDSVFRVYYGCSSGSSNPNAGQIMAEGAQITAGQPIMLEAMNSPGGFVGTVADQGVLGLARGNPKDTAFCSNNSFTFEKGKDAKAVVIRSVAAEQASFVSAYLRPPSPDSLAGSPACQNNHQKCDYWSTKGECDNNPSYMLKDCKVACGLCPLTSVALGLKQSAPDDTEVFMAASQFILTRSTVQLPQGSKILVGDNRQYAVAPLGHVIEERYTVYFNVTTPSDIMME